MRSRRIFLLIVLAVVIFSCDEEDVKPADSLEGSWDISWEISGQRLEGRITFGPAEAVIETHGTSSILAEPALARYFYDVKDENLILVNKSSHLRMEYVIVDRNRHEWKLRYLDDIHVSIGRK